MQNPILHSVFKPTKFQPSRWTLAFLLLASMLILMGGAAVAPALPLISDSFPDASGALVAMIITLPSLAVAFTGIFVGGLSDRLGRLPVLTVSLLIFTIAGVSGSFLSSLPAILAGRFVLGIGIAGITTSTAALITDYYSDGTRAKVLGYQAAAMGLGVLVLETSGGLLAAISWRAAFLIYLIGLVILIGVLVTMREPVRESMSHGNLEKESTTHFENMSKTLPVFDVILILATLFVSMLMFFLVPIKLPYLMADIISSTGLAEAGGMFANASTASGLFLGLMGLASAATAVVHHRISSRMHRMSVLAVAYLLVCGGLAALGLSESLPVIALGVIALGVSNGMYMPILLNWLVSVTPLPIIGKVMGGYSVVLNVGVFVASLMFVPVLALVGTNAGLFSAYCIPAGGLALLYIGGCLATRLTPPADPSPQRN